MSFHSKLILAGCALLLFCVSMLMRSIGANNSFVQKFSGLSLALSVMVAGISVGLLMTQ